MRGVRLQQVLNIVICVETFGVFENWSMRRGGRLREVVATGGSAVRRKAVPPARITLPADVRQLTVVKILQGHKEKLTRPG